MQKIVHRVAGISSALDSRLNEIMRLETQIKVKERRILDKEGEIYEAEINTLRKIDDIIELQTKATTAIN